MSGKKAIKIMQRCKEQGLSVDDAKIVLLSLRLQEELKDME